MSITVNESVSEAAGWATAAVSLSRSTQVPVTVSWSTSNGSAIAGSDYSASSGTLTFHPGDTRKTVSVQILNNTVYEANEQFTIGLTSASGATVGSSTCTVTILNDDPMPSLLGTKWTVRETSHPNELETWLFTSNGYYYDGFVKWTTYVNGLYFWHGQVTYDTNAPRSFWWNGGEHVYVGYSYHNHSGSLDPAAMTISGQGYRKDSSSTLEYTFKGWR